MQAAEPDWQCRFGDDCVYKRVVRPQTAAAGTKRRGVTRGGYVDGGVATAGASAEEDPAKGSKARAKPEWPAAAAAAAAGEKASAAAAVGATERWALGPRLAPQRPRQTTRETGIAPQGVQGRSQGVPKR